MSKLQLIQGDCLIKLKELDDNSIDSIVTDPPAGISFMGKSWDTDKGGRDNWIKWMCDVATECKRVLKPGGHAFVWAIPRTSHWTATAWENAGFEIRDVVAHIFGSGFPKSLNIGKAVDRLQGNEREDLGYNDNSRTNKPDVDVYEAGIRGKESRLTKGTSEWEGWGTALKPAREDWILMRKPLEKGLSIAENVLKWGTGGINIDESRVEPTGDVSGWSQTGSKAGKNRAMSGDNYEREPKPDNPQGRFPANLIHDNSEEVRECFPETGKSTGGRIGNKGSALNMMGQDYEAGDPGYGDSGNASRFFKSIIYQAKASKSERNRGCEDMETSQKFTAGNYSQSPTCKDCNLTLNGTNDHSKCSGEVYYKEMESKNTKNNHPTVKPIALMEYLIKMVTPKGGIVLDPFMGSGTTGIACRKLNYGFIGIELEPDYITIAKARIDSIKAVQEKLL